MNRGYWLITCSVSTIGFINVKYKGLLSEWRKYAEIRFPRYDDFVLINTIRLDESEYERLET